MSDRLEKHIKSIDEYWKKYGMYASRDVHWLISEVERLDGLLKEIEEHEHCDYPKCDMAIPAGPDTTLDCIGIIEGMQIGHRCAAQIAGKRHAKD